MKAKLIFCNVPTKNAANSQKFYGALFGSANFARSLNAQHESYHMPISNDGIDLNISARAHPQESTCCYYAVQDLNAAVQALEQAGGKVVMQPTPLPITPQAALDDYTKKVKSKNPHMVVTSTLGTAAVLRDPDGNLVGVIQLEAHAHDHFKVGNAATPISANILADHKIAIEAGHKV